MLGMLGLTVIELLDIVRICGTLQVGKCSPFYLADYLAGSLVAHDPELAAKVRRYNEPELETLCECIEGVKASLDPVARRNPRRRHPTRGDGVVRTGP